MDNLGTNVGADDKNIVRCDSGHPAERSRMIARRIAALAAAGLAVVAPTMQARAELSPDYIVISGNNTEHLDLGLSFFRDVPNDLGVTNGFWDAYVHSINFSRPDEPRGVVMLRPDQVLIQIPDAALVPYFPDPDWSLIGAEPGARYWEVPESPVLPAVPWVGFEASRQFGGSRRMEFETGWADWDPDGAGPTLPYDAVEFSLVGVRGPGHFSLFRYDELTGAPIFDMATSDGVDLGEEGDEYLLRVGGHTHTNLAFTAAGRYEVDLRARTYILDAQGDRIEKVSPVTTFHFQVGALPAAAVPETGTAGLVGAATILPLLGALAVRRRSGAAEGGG